MPPRHDARRRHWPFALLVGLVALGFVLVARWRDEPAAPPTPASERVGEQPAAMAVESPVGGAPARVPDDRAPAIRSPVEPDGEWRDTEWLELVRDVPPFQLEVCVQRCRSPVANAIVQLWTDPDLQGARTGGSAPVARAETDGEGRVLFGRLGPGQYVARVDDAGQHVIGEAVLLRGDGVTTSRTCVLLFGDASIDGIARDERGARLPFVPIVVAGIGPLPARRMHEVTARDGSFRFAGLTAGRYHVMLGFPEEPPGGHRMLTLQAGEQAEVLFGPSPQQATWRGRLVDVDGGPLPVPLRLLFRGERNDERWCLCDKDARFAIDLPAGRWQASVTDDLFRGVELGTVDVPSGGLEHDLVHPGAVARVKLTPRQLRREQFDGLGEDVRLIRPGNAPLAPAACRPTGGSVDLLWILPEPADLCLRSDNHTRFVADDPMEVTLPWPAGVRVLHATVVTP